MSVSGVIHDNYLSVPLYTAEILKDGFDFVTYTKVAKWTFCTKCLIVTLSTPFCGGTNYKYIQQCYLVAQGQALSPPKFHLFSSVKKESLLSTFIIVKTYKKIWTLCFSYKQYRFFLKIKEGIFIINEYIKYYLEWAVPEIYFVQMFRQMTTKRSSSIYTVFFNVTVTSSSHFKEGCFIRLQQ